MFTNSKEILIKAKENKYAIPHFNINNLEWAKFILEKCQELNVPVILGVSEGAAKYMGGFHTITGMIKGLLKDLNISIPVCLHVDHGTSYKTCQEAIDAGFTSVMIDASRLELSDNIKITKEVVDYAHKYNVTEETTNIDINGLYATCFPEYEEKTGTILTNIFDETEIGILNAYGKNISSCIEKDYSIYRPFIYRLLMQPMEYTIYSNIKFNRTIALSNILTISNRTDILVKGTFTAEEAIDILLSVSKKPEKYGFYEETKNTIKIKK